MKKILYLAFVAIALTSCNQTSQKKVDQLEEVSTDEQAAEVNAEAMALANAHGYQEWKNVKQIDFTFNVDRDGQKVASRSWSWKPQTNEVTFRGNQDTITYMRSAVDTTTIDTDKRFVNDKYWLLPQFQLIWDEGAEITNRDGVLTPLSQESAKMITITYTGDGGYTPGDAYDIYYGDDFKIKEWVFRKGAQLEASMVNKFENYETFKGLLIPTSHPNEDGSFSIYFTDINVTQ